MAALTLPEALKRTQNPAMAAVAKEIVTTDAFGALVPMMMLGSSSVPVPREGGLPAGGAFIGDDGATSEESTGTDDVVHVPVRRIVGDFDVDNLAEETAPPAGNSHRGAQLAKKIKATWRKVAEKLITGSHVTSHTIGSTADPFAAIGTAGVGGIAYGPWLDSSRRGPGSIKYVNATQSWYFRAPGDVDYGAAVPATTDGTYVLRSWNQSYFIQVTLDVSDATADGETHIRFTSTSKEWDGLEMLVHPDRLLDPTDADGDNFGFSMLDKLITNEKIKTNRAFLMRSELTERYHHMLRALGGASPPMMSIAGYGGGDVLSYRRIPILECDWVPADETVGATTDCTSIYLVSLDEVEGLSLGVVNGGETFNVDGDPRGRATLGWRISNLGERDAYDHNRTRVKLYGTPVLKSTQALVRRRGVKSSYAA